MTDKACSICGAPGRTYGSVMAYCDRCLDEAQQAATPAAPVCRYCDGRGIYISKDIANGQEVEIACSYCGETGVAPAAPVQDDGSLTLDNASVQRLMDYNLLHHGDNGWYIARLAPDRVTPLVERLRQIVLLAENARQFTDRETWQEMEREARAGLRDGGFDA